MRCPVCSAGPSRVVNSRQSVPDDPDELATVVRSRACRTCGSRWNTVEAYSHMTQIEGVSTRPERIASGELHARPPSRARLTLAQLAAEYGVTVGHIRKIRRGDAWGPRTSA
jgi:hypothetical protein